MSARRRPWRHRPSETGTSRRTRRRVPMVVVGIVVVLLGIGALVASFQKLNIEAHLESGTTIHATFADDYDDLIRPYWTKVEVADVPVGVVTGLHTTTRGRAQVAMKITSRTALEALGSSPRASVELLTLLGGNIDIELHPGGSPGVPHGAIPMARTTTPVYLGRVLDAFTPQARAGLQTTVTQLQGAMANGGIAATQDLLAQAPATLSPTGAALGALEGDRPGDLTTLVDDLSAIARTLTDQQGQLQGILGDAGSVSATLGQDSAALGATVASLPATLTSARVGLRDLHDILVQLQQVSGPLEPSAPLLSALLREAEPTLQAALPVVQALPPLLGQAAPLLSELAPTAVSATSLLRDVQGPVLNRVLNPIVPTLLAPYEGSAKPMYQEIGYMLSGLDGIGEMTDANGAMISFEPGVNLESLGGLPFTSPLSYHNNPPEPKG